MNHDQPNNFAAGDHASGYANDHAVNYTKSGPQLTSSNADFWGDNSPKNSPPAGRADKTGNAGRTRRRRRLKQPKLPKLHMPKLRSPKLPKPRLKRRSARPARPRKKRTPVFTATVSGLICSAIVLLTEVGIWGLYCYSRTLPGDTNANASTFMYCFAVFAGCFWAGAVVKRRSVKPPLIICGVYLGLSLLISLRLFALADFKPLMFLLKIFFTLVAALLGFVLSLVPYLINKSLKQQRKRRRQRRNRAADEYNEYAEYTEYDE